MKFDNNINRLECKSHGFRTAKYETPLNQNRKIHMVFKRQYRLRESDCHMNRSILMGFERMASLNRRFKVIW